MNTRTMSHMSDPITSSDAASQVNPHDTLRLKLALIDLLDEKPRTGDELITSYGHLAPACGWPTLIDPHSVKRRLSELHRRHAVIRESGLTRTSRMGRAATVWTLVVSADEARAIVNAS